MDHIVDKDGKKIEMPRDSDQAAAAEQAAKAPAAEQGAAAAAPEDPEKPPLWGQISNTGIMQLEINLARLSQAPELMDQFVGFMERHKAVGLSQMVQQQRQRALIRAAVQKTQAQNGHRSLLDKVFRRR